MIGSAVCPTRQVFKAVQDYLVNLEGFFLRGILSIQEGGEDGMKRKKKRISPKLF